LFPYTTLFRSELAPGRIEPAFPQVVVFEENPWIAKPDEPWRIERPFAAEGIKAPCARGQTPDVGNLVELGRPHGCRYPFVAHPHGHQHVAVVDRDGKEPFRAAPRKRRVDPAVVGIEAEAVDEKASGGEVIPRPARIAEGADLFNQTDGFRVSRGEGSHGRVLGLVCRMVTRTFRSPPTSGMSLFRPSS